MPSLLALLYTRKEGGEDALFDSVAALLGDPLGEEADGDILVERRVLDLVEERTARSSLAGTSQQHREPHLLLLGGQDGR